MDADQVAFVQGGKFYSMAERIKSCAERPNEFIGRRIVRCRAGAHFEDPVIAMEQGA